jgi:nicotinate-nucleotide pyrophosphorylase (carboxylating)
MATISEGATAKAVIAARKPGTLAGLPLTACAFAEIGPGLKFTTLKRDGDRLKPGDTVARVEGPARPILAAERVALNFLCHLSGIASETAKLVALVAHTKARICCTRKTTPGLRALEKYAVRCGGGSNHRFGLDDAVLIKDNHIAVAGGVAKAIARARAFAGHLVKIEVEVDDLDQLREALKAMSGKVGTGFPSDIAQGHKAMSGKARPGPRSGMGTGFPSDIAQNRAAPDAVLLDNMTPAMLKKAVKLVAGRVATEASGGITPDTVAAIAESGVDYISSGWITHSAPALDLGLDIEIGRRRKS